MAARIPPARRAAAMMLAGALAGCTVGPDFKAPTPPASQRVTETPLPIQTVSARTPGGAAQRLQPGRDIPGDWWTLFRSNRIEALVTQALAANPDLAAAQATLLQARENMRAEQGALFPSLGANLQNGQQRISPYEFGGSGATDTRPFTLHYPQATLSYTLDAFGGIRRQVEALGAQADYERYQLEAAYLSLTANVVATALTESALQAQIDATNDIIRIYQRSLDITRSRFQAGGVTQSDVLQQQANLASAQANLPPLQKQLQQQRNQLAVYLGTTPDRFSGETVNLDKLTLPEDLPVSLPSSLVEQRPDIRAYEALLHEATANVGVATANLLPQITLSASYGRQANSFANLFTPAGIVWSVAGALSQPVFQGGTLLAQKRASEAALQAAAAQYSSTVNTAFQSVANALVAIERDAETLQADLAAEQAARASLNVAQAQFQAGGIPYVSVLQTEQTYQSARLALVSARAARFTDTVALFQALGGGWWNRSDVDPKVADCCGLMP
ncbi:MAG: efflux transporter outer membrane subunit [Proteobacteria bacterium]|nr:efflux transporter outer membrane subunit [Pseudomonadota bacterium]